jgi:type I restriction enzyme, R subunit
MSFDEQNLLRKQTEQALANAGWEFEFEARIVPGRFRITGDATHESAPVADYVLRFRGITFAVVETKYGGKDLDAATEQATGYARRLGVGFAIATDGVKWSVRNLVSDEISLCDTPPTPEELVSQSNLPLGSKGWGDAMVAEPYARKNIPASLRPYQEQAILAALSHFACGNRRASLLMSPNVGLTHTTFQLIWKLLSTNVLKNRRVLFVTDRRQRVEEAYQCFTPFGDARVIIDRHSKNESHHKVYFSTLQMLCRDSGSGRLYESYSGDFFDLIIFGDGRYAHPSLGGFLSHFEQTLQLGMFDAPYINAFDYFGLPVFEYSMGQAINDGYLLPFLLEARSQTLEMSDADLLLEEQLERSVVTAERTKEIATDLWKTLSRFDENQRKSIVFCVNNTHAAMMAAELQRVSRDPSFATHISAAGKESQLLIERFCNGGEDSPRVAVFVDLRTKVSIPEVTNIVLAEPISNPTVFSRTVALGALPCEAIGKRYFTVFDYCGSVQALDTEWMGYPENNRELLRQSEPIITASHPERTTDEFESGDLRDISESIRALCSNNLAQLYLIWASQDDRSKFRDALGDQLQSIEALRRRSAMSGVDDVDVLAKVGFGLEEVPTRKDRVRIFWNEEGPWLQSRLGLKPDSTADDEEMDSWKLTFWTVTLDHYSLYGIDQLERGRTYQLPQFVGKFGSFHTLTSQYGGPKQLRADLEAVKKKMYVPVAHNGGDTE